MNEEKEFNGSDVLAQRIEICLGEEELNYIKNKLKGTTFENFALNDVPDLGDMFNQHYLPNLGENIHYQGDDGLNIIYRVDAVVHDTYEGQPCRVLMLVIEEILHAAMGSAVKLYKEQDYIDEMDKDADD